jgi:hypothetical protein
MSSKIEEEAQLQLTSLSQGDGVVVIAEGDIDLLTALNCRMSSTVS